MNATTMEAAAHRASAILDPRPVMKRLAQPVIGAFEGAWGVGRWIWHFDLGAAVLVGEQTARFAKVAVERGRAIEPTLIKPFKKAGDSVSDTIGEVGTRLKEVARPLTAAGKPRGQAHRRARAAKAAAAKAH